MGEQRAGQRPHASPCISVHAAAEHGGSKRPPSQPSTQRSFSSPPRGGAAGTRCQTGSRLRGEEMGQAGRQKGRRRAPGSEGGQQQQCSEAGQQQQCSRRLAGGSPAIVALPTASPRRAPAPRAAHRGPWPPPPRCGARWPPASAPPGPPLHGGWGGAQCRRRWRGAVVLGQSARRACPVTSAGRRITSTAPARSPCSPQQPPRRPPLVCS